MSSWYKSKSYVFNEDGTCICDGVLPGARNIKMKPLCEWTMKYFESIINLCRPSVYSLDRHRIILNSANARSKKDVVTILYEEWEKQNKL